MYIFSLSERKLLLIFLDIKRSPFFKMADFEHGLYFSGKIKIFISELRNRHPLQNFPIMLTE